MNVGVRELKQRLSECLETAAGGETVTVTDRGRPKVLIIAVAGASELRHGIEAGWIREPLRAGGLPAVESRPGRRSTTSVLGEDRDE